MPSVDDVVAAARALRRAPRFSALSIAVLALGIAANVILFAVGIVELDLAAAALPAHGAARTDPAISLRAE